MNDDVRFRLHFGPYQTPKFLLGDIVFDAVRGWVRIVGLSDARIAWPVGVTLDRVRNQRALVVFRDLELAIRQESNQAVANWWGITPQTITKWRKGIGVESQTVGTHLLRKEHGREDWFREVQKLAVAKADDPERRRKIADARRGKPRPKWIIEAMRQVNLGHPPSDETRKRMSDAHKRRGTRPPKAGRAWTDDELKLLAVTPPIEVARLTNRTLAAVYIMRGKLRRSAIQQTLLSRPVSENRENASGDWQVRRSGRAIDAPRRESLDLPVGAAP